MTIGFTLAFAMATSLSNSFSKEVVSRAGDALERGRALDAPDDEQEHVGRTLVEQVIDELEDRLAT